MVMKKMNRKGFTLIELLATIVLLAIVGGIASASVLSAINNSKAKSEKVFVEKISNLIDDYLDLESPTNPTGTTISFDKCKDTSCTKSYSVTARQMLKKDGSKIYLKDLIDANLVNQSDLINPKNKEQCLTGTSLGPEIIIYKDSDYVYYYYTSLAGTNTSCNISTESGVINTLPDNLKSKVGLS